MRVGYKNLITDVMGLRVGNADCSTLKSGTSVLVSNVPFTAAVEVMGGAPGTRETDLLAPDRTVQNVDAIVLSGGSAFGLDAASGVADKLATEGRGFPIGDVTVPIVPSAILFDLLNGGDKSWKVNPYRELGRSALDAAAEDFGLGSVGAGYGATTLDLRGGLGSASVLTGRGFVVGALVAVNSFGSVIQNDGPHFWAAPFEFEREFGGLAASRTNNPQWVPSPMESNVGANTTIGIVATDAELTKAQAKRLAVSAHAGMARAICPSHTVYDGDVVFAIATGQRHLEHHDFDLLEISHAAAACLSRAIARGVYHADHDPKFPLPSWRKKYSHHLGDVK